MGSLKITVVVWARRSSGFESTSSTSTAMVSAESPPWSMDSKDAAPRAPDLAGVSRRGDVEHLVQRFLRHQLPAQVPEPHLRGPRARRPRSSRAGWTWHGRCRSRLGRRWRRLPGRAQGVVVVLSIFSLPSELGPHGGAPTSVRQAVCERGVRAIVANRRRRGSDARAHRHRARGRGRPPRLGQATQPPRRLVPRRSSPPHARLRTCMRRSREFSPISIRPSAKRGPRHEHPAHGP